MLLIIIIAIIIIYIFSSEPKQSDEPAEKTEEGEDASAADIQNPAEYRELFQGNIRQGKHFIWV